ncbi:hypothetical protein [Specibacter cremeus]|uniref:hypothetical protein n=1 Tax=Specibacter cremeus TaxID=1629051 RepID=UPI0013DD9E37|nr:hypothetical protein [Specibacter cremeus]
MRLPRTAVGAILLLGLVTGLVAGCGAAGSSTPTVPALGAGSTGMAGAGRAAAVRAAAQCIREHGVPGYQDPVLTADGLVFSDLRSLQDASQATMDAVQSACAGLAASAGFNPLSEPPAPPALVAAGVKAAECLRGNGLANYADPTAQTGYVPGHGFSATGSEMPAGGKADPIWQNAAHACRSLLDAEILASTLGNLGHG